MDEGLVDEGARGEAGDPPAILLRLPRAFAAGTARSRALLDLRTARRLECGAGFAIGTPVSRYGAVKLWRARSVDLRGLLFGFLRSSFSPPEGVDEEKEGRRQLSSAGLVEGRKPIDELVRRLAAALQPPPEALLGPLGPLEWPGSFFPYQRDGIQALIQSSHLLLGDDMGLGKAIQTIAALRLLFYRRELERALIVVPASLLEQWRRELLLWAPELRVMLVHGPPEDRSWRWQYRAHVTLTSYDILRIDYTGTRTCGPCREPWSVVVLDEAQRIKNRDTDVSRASKGLPRERSWALTGTPLENRAEDVLSILEFVTGGGGEGVKNEERGMRYEEEPPALIPHSSSLVPRSSPPHRLSLHAALSQFQLRRRKADVLRDLPPKIVTDLVLPLTRAQRLAYERAERDGVVALRERGDVRVENVVALITRLKQICNFAPSGHASAKMDDLIERLEELTAEGHKAVLFTQYTSAESGARRIAAGLQRFAPLLYTGDMSPSARSQTVDRFQQEEEHPVLIVSIQAGGQGLNLQRAAYVFHFDRWWNPAVERQAEDRAHRMGQTQPVHVYRYIMQDTIEERMHELLKRKVNLFERIVDETSLDLSRLVDQRDLFELVGLAPPERKSAADPTGASLEGRVAALLVRQGYQVERTGGRHDGGVDLIAEKLDTVGARLRLFVQCKETDRPAGVEVIRSLYGALPPAERGATGVVVCPAGFTPEARAFASARHVQLWDATRLDRLEAERA